MKRLLIGGLLAISLIIGNSVLAPKSTETAAQPASKNELKDKTLPGATIDDITIPYEVLIEIEADYPGHAVVKASQITGDKELAYRLRIDRDTNSRDYQGFYLFYDKDWGRVDDEKLKQPRVEIKSEPNDQEVADQTERQSEPDKKPEPPKPKPDPDQPKPEDQPETNPDNPAEEEAPSEGESRGDKPEPTPRHSR